ncbi:ankyrin repeat domain-containing protein [Myxococcus sp. CA051A]|uniref:ankyrin repeat domain-containing protein n=1 Tax=Myxococcus sp. CA051A TaxID=2741739 RepID=UPI00157A5603|nr:ankyrin repeat domain-containing protein [Myxococcus sp. CA051A]NTX64307.1 ankyrin repeat domain-containing protein [Myxococcus sp. CA051A]
MLSSELFEAIVQHDLERVRALLVRGADPNLPREDGWRPLHVAIGQMGVGGTIDFIKLLIEHGADVNEWDAHHHETPLLSAMEPPELEVARVLLEAGADPNVRRSTHESPLQLAVEHEHPELTALLLRHGAGRTMDEWGGLRGLTPLGMAARKFNVPIIELLMAEGADPRAVDEYNETALAKLPPREEHDPRTWDRILELLGRRRS